MGQTQTHNAIACFVPSSNNGIKGTVKFYQNGKCEIKEKEADNYGPKWG